ncbi:MAG: DUF4919 domain-containing protein [Bacteroidetes bacterium]|nr:DUF4919 domain-containing protein [Bacteroidota bacterium]
MKKSARILALCLFVFSCLKMEAQSVFGETIEVLEQRLKADSTLYDRIGSRLIAGDTTLTLNELSTVYYGNALRSGYNPVHEDRILDAVSSLARRDRYEDAVKLIDNFLVKNPGSLPGWLERGYTFFLAEDSLQTVETYRKYYRLLDVPLKSGSGESFERAFVAASLRDVELVVDKLGYLVRGQSLVVKNGQNYQIVNCTKEGDKAVKPVFYFNVELPVKRGMQQSLKKKG